MRRILPLALLLACPVEEEAGENAESSADTIGDDLPSPGCGESPETLADCINPARYAADLGFIADVRTPGSPHWQAVQDRCADRLAAAGYEVERQSYASGVNVIGTRLGAETPDEVVLLSAHYDHIAGCPGADDNATGVAAALEMARVLAVAELPRTVMVACWDEEEVDLRGSAAFVSGIADSGLDITVNFNFDMIGYTSDAPMSQTLPAWLDDLFPDAAEEIADDGFRGNFILVVSNSTAHDAAVDLLAHADGIALNTVLLDVPDGAELDDAYTDTRRSDHASLWAAGIPAVLLTDTADFRNPHYHCREGEDTIASLDEEFAMNVARATIAAVAVAGGL